MTDVNTPNDAEMIANDNHDENIGEEELPGTERPLVEGEEADEELVEEEPEEETRAEEAQQEEPKRELTEIEKFNVELQSYPVRGVTATAEQPNQEEQNKPEPKAEIKPPEDGPEEIKAKPEQDDKLDSIQDIEEEGHANKARDEPITQAATEDLSKHKDTRAKETEDQKKIREEFQVKLNDMFKAACEDGDFVPCKDHGWKQIKYKAIKDTEYNDISCYNCSQSPVGRQYIICNHADHETKKVICEKCIIKHTFEKEDQDSQKFTKLPFFEKPLMRVEGQKAMWTCGSELLKSNLAVPEEWAVCSLSINDKLKQDDFYSDSSSVRSLQLHKFPFYLNEELGIKICGVCTLKWKLFAQNLVEGTDYTQFSHNMTQKIRSLAHNCTKNTSEDDTLNQVFIKSPLHPKYLEPSNNFTFDFERLEIPSGIKGSEVLKDIKSKFVRESIAKNTKFIDFNIHHFIPNKEEHNACYPPACRGTYLDGYQYSQNLEQVDMQMVTFKDDYWIIVACSEHQEFETSSCEALTLKIYSANDQFELQDNIITQVNTSSQMVNGSKFDSYFIQGQFMYYFKRIYLSDYGLERDIENAKSKNLNRMNPDTSVPDISDDDDEFGAKTLPNQSYLQLCRYNLKTRREKYIQDYCILEKDGPLRAVFNMNYGEQYILLSTKSDLHMKLMDSSKAAIKLANEAHYKFESSTVIVDINQMEYLYQIGNSTYDLISEIDEMRLVADHSQINDDEQQNVKRKLEELQKLEEFDKDSHLDEPEKILFKSQYFALFQQSTSQSEYANEENALHTHFHLYRMNNPLKPFRVVRRDEGESISRTLKTTDVTFEEFTESSKYPNLQMHNGAEFLEQVAEAQDEEEMAKIDQQLKASNTVKRKKTIANKEPDADQLKFKQIIQIFSDNKKIQITIDPNEEEENIEEEEPEESEKKTENQPAEGEEQKQEEKSEERLDTEELEKLRNKELGIEIFEGSSLFNITKIWSLQVDNCVLPGQDAACSYTQYVTYDIEQKEYILIYPDFNDGEEIKEGEGDNTETQSMKSYLLAKAEKQQDDMPLAQKFLVKGEMIQEKIKRDFSVTCFDVCEYDFFAGSHYQALIWMNQDGGFNINVLQFCLGNQLLPGDDRIYDKPLIGKYNQINDVSDSENTNLERQLRNMVDSRGGSTIYINSKYRQIFLKENEITGNLKDSKQQVGSEMKFVVEGKDGMYQEFKEPKPDIVKMVGLGAIKFRQRCQGKDLFVLQFKEIDVFIIQNQAEDGSVKPLTINKTSKIYYIYRKNHEDFVCRKSTVMQFINMKQQYFEKLKESRLTFQEIMDSKYESPMMPLIYSDNSGYNPQNFYFLVVDFSLETPNIKAIKIQMHEQINEHIFFADTKLLRTSERIYNHQNDMYQTQYSFCVFVEKPIERYIVQTIQVNENNIESKEVEPGKKARSMFKMDTCQRLDESYENTFQFVRTIEIIISPDLYKKINYTYFLSLLPIYCDKLMNIIGFQLMWRANGEDNYTPFYNDQTYFVSPKYSTDIMWLEQRKIFRKDSKANEYAMLVDCQFKKSVINAGCFDQFEQRYLLEHAKSSLMNMLKYRLKHYILEEDNATSFKTFSFFKKREYLHGNSLIDIFVKDPTLIGDALYDPDLFVNHDDESELTSNEQIYSQAGSIIMNQMKKTGFFKGNSVFVLQSNFYQENLIHHALKQKMSKTVSLMIEYIFDQDDKNQFQAELMKALPMLLEQEKIDPKFMQFFDAPEQGTSFQSTCLFESLIDDPMVPLYSRNPWNVYQIAQIKDYNNYTGELVEFLKEKEVDAAKNALAKGETTMYDVKNSFIDFRLMILNQKFMTSHETRKLEYEFNNYTLSKLIENVDNSSFFETSSIQKVIDHMQVKSAPATKKQSILFVTCYYIPFIISLFVSHRVADIVFSLISLMTLLFFLGIEYIQFQENGWQSYFESFWNVADLFQYASFIIIFFTKISNEFNIYEDGLDKPVVIILFECVLLMTGFVKILFFMQLSPEYSSLVSMVTSTFGSVGPFIRFLILWIVFFTVLYYNLRIEIEEGDDQYLNLPPVLQYFMMTYRDSIGDISIPGYLGWDKKFGNETAADRTNKTVIILMIWIVWLMNQFMCLIVLLNFLIAVISQVYDNVIAEQKQIMYINRASLNGEYFQLLKFLGLISNYKILIFQVQAKEQDEESDEFLGFVQTIKNFVQKQNKEVSKKIDALNVSLSDKMEQSFAKLADRVHVNEEAIHKVSRAIEQNKTDILKELRSWKSASGATPVPAPAPTPVSAPTENQN